MQASSSFRFISMALNASAVVTNFNFSLSANWTNRVRPPFSWAASAMTTTNSCLALNQLIGGGAARQNANRHEHAKRARWQ